MTELFPTLWDWLWRPIGGTAHHTPPDWLAWHGRLMVLGWAIAAPVGALAARYFKVRPGRDWPHVLDDKRWWHTHRWLQSLGLLAATGGLWLAWRHAAGGTALARWHALIGWTVMLLGWGQVAGALQRGSKGGPTDPHGMAGDHFDMTPRRIAFEHLHKVGGYAALALALAAVPTGLLLAGAPRWMWLAIGLWWAALALATVRLQRAGRCVDTYQAIWGPAPDLPGNRRRPIGWGISRPLDRARR